MPPPADPWTHLGLPPGSAAAEVRRAYARLLKSIDQQADPETFRALRAAFEAASGQVGQRPRPAASTSDPAAPPPATAPYQQILGLSLGGRFVEAARLFDESVRAHRLSFDEEDALSIRLARALQGPALRDQPLVEEISALMAWETTSRQNAADWVIVRVVAARDAGRWLAELEKAAAMPRWLSLGWMVRRRAARCMLKPAPGRLIRILAYFDPSRGLDYWVEGAERHRVLLDDWLDPGRLDWCAQQVRLRRARTLPRLAGIAALLLAATSLVELIVIGLWSVFLS